MNYSGSGGSVTFLRFDDDWEPTEPMTIDVSLWNIQDHAAPTDITNCSSEGMRSATMGYQISWSLSFPAFELYEPEYLSLFAGEPVTMWFKVGSRSVANYHRLQNTMIAATVPVCNSAGDAVRYTMSGTGGKITYYTADGPTLYPPPIIPMAMMAGQPSAGSTPPASSGSLTYPSGV